MMMEKEISVSVTTDYNSLDKILLNNGFNIKEEYLVNDVYMINENLDLKKLSNLEILSNTVIVRYIENIVKELLYKYKKYDEDGSIIEQGKVCCPVLNIEQAILFMESIHYKKLFNIMDKCIVYANDDIDLIVQIVNDKYIMIEMEDKQEFSGKNYEDINLMKKDLLKYNLPIDTSNFFVKKAEIVLKEVLKNR